MSPEEQARVRAEAERGTQHALERLNALSLGAAPRPGAPAMMRAFLLREAMTAEQVMAAVSVWQARGFPHALLCGQSGHRPLVAMPGEDDVELRCPDCGYRQSWIPEEVLRFPDCTSTGRAAGEGA